MSAPGRPTPLAETLPPARSISWRKAALRLGISFGVLALLFVFIPFGEVAEAIGRLTPSVWAIALLTYLCLHFIGVVKWRLVINAAGAGLGIVNATRAYYAGLFGNTILPSIIGGDVIRAGLVYRVVHSRAGLVLGSVIDRVLDFVGLLTVAGLAALLVPRALDPQSRQVFLTVAGLLAGLGVAGFIAMLLLPVRRLRYGIRRKLVLLRRAFRAVRRRPSALIAAFVLGLALQSLLVVLNYWLGVRAGIDIPLYVWMFVWPLAKMSGIAPTQNGIGVREAAQVALFVPFGVSPTLALAVGIVFEVIIIGGGLVAGLIALLIGRVMRRRQFAAAGPSPAA